MKKVTILILMIFILSMILTGFLLAANKSDIQVIKKAVKKNPNYEAGHEAKWFKVLVTNTHSKRDRVKITLPISLVEFFLKCSESKSLYVDCDDYDIDLRELFLELKKLGPTVLIELEEDGDIFKVWLE